MAGRSFTVGIRVEAEDRASASIAKIEGSTRGFESAVRRLGVTLEKDANAALRKNAVILKEAEQAYARSAITLEDYRRIQERVATQNTRIQQSLAGTAGSANAARGAFGGLSGALNSLALRGAAVVLSIGAITRALRASVAGALEQESAEKRRTLALERSGAASAELVAGLDAQAAALQRTTKFQDDAVIGLQAYLLELGITADRTAEATQATVDFASRFDLSLSKAAKAVAGVFRGELSPGIAQLIPELKAMKEAGASAGEMMKFFEERVRGAAKAAGETRAGAIEGLKNDIGELGEAFVDGATKTNQFIEGVGGIRAKVQETTPAFETFGAVIATFFAGIITIAQKVGAAIGVVFSAFDQLRPSMDRFEASNAGLGATAERLGITVEELKRRLDATGVATVGLVDASTRAQASTAALGATVQITAEQLAKMEAAAAAAASATEELAQKLGVVTTVQIGQQIFEIGFALEKVRLEGSLTSAEFARLEEIAGAKIEALKARIDSLGQGLGDVAAKSTETTSAVAGTAESFESAAASSDSLTGSLQRQAAQLGVVAARAIQTAAALSQVSGFSTMGGGFQVTQTARGVNRVSSPELTGRNASGMNANTRLVGFGYVGGGGLYMSAYGYGLSLGNLSGLGSSLSRI